MAEAWVATFKSELVDGRRFGSYEHAEHETLHWIGFYNKERLHEELGDLPPVEYEMTRFDGRHYELSGVHPGPAPAHPIQIWIGANRRRALALTGRVADGWVSPLMSYKPPRAAAQANLANDRAAREAGRDPREIRRIYNVQGAFTSTTQGPAADTDQGVIGPPEHWVEVLAHLALDVGLSTFVLATPPDPDTLSTFIEDVAPNVRERVAERRVSPRRVEA